MSTGPFKPDMDMSLNPGWFAGSALAQKPEKGLKKPPRGGIFLSPIGMGRFNCQRQAIVSKRANRNFNKRMG
jgi:hypothetical protein